MAKFNIKWQTLSTVMHNVELSPALLYSWSICIIAGVYQATSLISHGQKLQYAKINNQRDIALHVWHMEEDNKKPSLPPGAGTNAEDLPGAWKDC